MVDAVDITTKKCRGPQLCRLQATTFQSRRTPESRGLIHLLHPTPHERKAFGCFPLHLTIILEDGWLVVKGEQTQVWFTGDLLLIQKVIGIEKGTGLKTSASCSSGLVGRKFTTRNQISGAYLAPVLPGSGWVLDPTSGLRPGRKPMRKHKDLEGKVVEEQANPSMSAFHLVLTSKRVHLASAAPFHPVILMNYRIPKLD